MTQKLSLPQLLEMLADQNVPRSELRPYFRLDENKSRAFDPRIVVDAEKIKSADNELTRLVVQTQSLSAIDAKRRQDNYRSKIKDGWKGLRLLSEGDSWFQYPVLLTDIIENLFDEYAIYCIAAAGDTLSNMKAGLPEIIKLIEQEHFDGFLLSGGGNDVIGDRILKYAMRGYNSAFQKPEDYIISARFANMISDIIRDMGHIFDALTNKFADLKIFCHGYDWAKPMFGGPYLWPVMENKEIPEELRHGIIKVMVNVFNAELKKLAARPQYNGRVVYVDCRDAVKNRWFDEIHPRDSAFKDVAGRFRAAINRALPGPLIA